MPDFSKIAPRKTKKGIASNVKSLIVPNQRFGIRRMRLKSNASTERPISPKTIAAPAKENATGYPDIKMKKNPTNMATASHSYPIFSSSTVSG